MSVGGLVPARPVKKSSAGSGFFPEKAGARGMGERANGVARAGTLHWTRRLRHGERWLALTAGASDFARDERRARVRAHELRGGCGDLSRGLPRRARGPAPLPVFGESVPRGNREACCRSARARSRVAMRERTVRGAGGALLGDRVAWRWRWPLRRAAGSAPIPYQHHTRAAAATRATGAAAATSPPALPLPPRHFPLPPPALPPAFPLGATGAAALPATLGLTRHARRVAAGLPDGRGGCAVDRGSCLLRRRRPGGRWESRPERLRARPERPRRAAGTSARAVVATTLARPPVEPTARRREWRLGGGLCDRRNRAPIQEAGCAVAADTTTATGARSCITTALSRSRRRRAPPRRGSFAPNIEVIGTTAVPAPTPTPTPHHRPRLRSPSRCPRWLRPRCPPILRHRGRRRARGHADRQLSRDLAANACCVLPTVSSCAFGGVEQPLASGPRLIAASTRRAPSRGPRHERSPRHAQSRVGGVHIEAERRRDVGHRHLFQPRPSRRSYDALRHPSRRGGHEGSRTASDRSMFSLGPGVVERSASDQSSAVSPRFFRATPGR